MSRDAPTPDHEIDPCEVIGTCPVCAGELEVVYVRNHQKVCVCRDCRSSITVPAAAWGKAKAKRSYLEKAHRDSSDPKRGSFR